MKPLMLSILALACLTSAGHAAARGRAEAVLANRVDRPVNALIESERWKCNATACAGAINVIGGRLDGPLAMRVCREIARRAGPVEALTIGEAAMPPAALARCNEVAALAPAQIAAGR